MIDIIEITSSIVEVVGQVQGPTGAKGDRGTDGANAYQIAVNNGYVGTEQDWLLTLKGEQGLPGVFEAHVHTKADIGLGNVDNTADIDKPVSIATQALITQINNQISAIQASNSNIVVANTTPNNNDGRPDGTLYLQII